MSYNITITDLTENVTVNNSTTNVVIDSPAANNITLEYNATVVQGGQGFTGSAGSAGNNGFTGSQGAGFTGSQGAVGFTGSEGAAGSVGFTGSKGDTGFVGSKGDVGFVGSGGAGFTGSQGNKAGFIYKFSNNTGIADPGAGYFRLNTGTNKIAISRINADGSDMGDLSANFIPIGSTIYLVSNTNNQSTYLKVDVQVISVRITGGQIAWFEITYVNSTVQGNFVNDEFTALQVTERGYTGSIGIGFAGSQGIQGVVGFTGSKGDIGYTGSYGPVDLVRATNDTASTTLYPVMVAAAGSDETAKVTTSKIEFNAATGVFKVTGEIVAEKLTIQYTTVTTTDIVTDDVFTILNATNASSTQTGALVVTGGAGFGQDLFIGGQTNVGGSILPTANGLFDLGSLTQRFRTLYVTSSTIDIGGATLSVNPEGYIDVDKIELTDATEASSTETGALIVTGGVGIGKNLHVGGEIIRNGISIGYAYTGSQGALGIQGDQGFTGSRGDTGFVGSQGIQGEIGFTGSQGDQGIQGDIGFTGSQGDQGNPGDIGFTGSQGIQGEQGIQGFTGSQGIQGEIGFTGSKGDTGFVGSQGIQGIQGEIGFTGSQGIQGEIGFTGSQGIQGEQGFTGSQGDLGYTGSQGIQGEIGFTGSKGDIGYTGSQGIQGERGYSSGRFYYFNYSQTEVAGFRDLGNDPTTATQHTATVTAIASSDTLIESYISDAFDFTLIPGGPQQFRLFMSKGAENNDVDVFVRLKLASNDGTILATIGDTNLGVIGWNANDTTPIEVAVDIVFTTTAVEIGQRMVAEVWTKNNDTTNRTVKFYTEGSANYSYVITTVEAAIGVTGYTGSQGIQGEIGFTGSRGSLNSNQDLFTTSTVEFSSIKLTAAPQSGYGATSINIGNDCYIGDSNVVNGFQVRGFDNDTFASSQGWIQFGNDFPLRRLGRYGGGYLPNAALTDAENPLIYEGQLQAKVLAVGTGTTIFTLPATDGAVGQALVTNGAGVVSWSNNTGYTGSQGDQGFTGSQGIQGELGYTGSQGDQGVIGFTGSFGITGYTGSQGIQGFTGSRGFTGSQGITGFVGSVGAGLFSISLSSHTIETGSKTFALLQPLAVAIGDVIRIYNSVQTSYMIGTMTGGNPYTQSGPDVVINVTSVVGSGTFSQWLLTAGQGYTGSKGDTGFVGSKGDIGFTGSQGVQGIQGFDGSQGVQGIQGIQGEQGIQGYTGSLGDLGYTGSKGEIGFTGSQGIQGIQGFTGSQGIQGNIGFTGSQGDIGFTGSQGVQGYTGSKGDTGLGFNIAKTYSSVAALTADTSPTGIVAGEFAIIETGDVEDPENSRLYLWNGTAYSYTTDLSGGIGITGAQGATGFVGSQGIQGDLGYTGSQGIQGETGATGAQGFTGSQGIQGDIGFTGSAGLTGDTGATGYTGSQGLTGEQGVQGNQGVQGYTGSQGIQGDLGYTGSQGIQGTTGFVGSQGIQGDFGYTGSAGTNGTNGDTGFTGSIGYTGSQGLAATSGKTIALAMLFN